MADGTSKRTIVIADDQPNLRRVLERLLRSEGYEVHNAADGKQALSLIRSIRPDLVVLDIMMPEMDGGDVAAALRDDPQTADIPIIFLTGKDRNDDMGRSFRSGGDMFIKKPFSCERLLEIVNIVLMSTGKR